MEVDRLNKYSETIWKILGLRMLISCNKEEIIYFTEDHIRTLNGGLIHKDEIKILNDDNKLLSNKVKQLELLIEGIPDRIKDIVNAGFDETLPIEDVYFTRTLFYMSENKLKYIYVSEWDYDRIDNVGDYE